MRPCFTFARVNLVDDLALAFGVFESRVKFPCMNCVLSEEFEAGSLGGWHFMPPTEYEALTPHASDLHVKPKVLIGADKKTINPPDEARRETGNRLGRGDRGDQIDATL